ncbi:antitoxin [Actinomadura sp. PM05-2]|uniref:Antitoxin n=2 Tax=Actinomadura parmotrematis TaxID=2864039 RepID=A0ABS7FTQ9_9ACTN|nr:antitoxin [Actinomadura parmotrematis]
MSIVDKVKEMLGQNAGAAKKAVDKAGDMVDQRTGGKYADKVDQVQEKARGYIDGGGSGTARPQEAPQEPRPQAGGEQRPS